MGQVVFTKKVSDKPWVELDEDSGFQGRYGEYVTTDETEILTLAEHLPKAKTVIHRHPVETELIWSSGEMQLWLEEGVRDLPKGEIAIIPPMVWHAIRHTPDTKDIKATLLLIWVPSLKKEQIELMEPQPEWPS